MKSIAYAIGILLALAVQFPVAAQQTISPLPAAEQARVTDLMNRALEASRREAASARADARLSTFDRADAQAQFAFTLLKMERCDESLRFMRERGEITAAHIHRLVFIARMQKNQSCVLNLYELILKRSYSTHPTPERQLGFRYMAAGYLHAAGRADARAIMDEAEKSLLASRDSEPLWDARWQVVEAYKGTPHYMPYLEYLAERMITEGKLAESMTGRSILALLAHLERCDLVRKVVRNGPTSCDRYKSLGQILYDPRPEQIGKIDEKAMLALFGVGDPPPVEEASIGRALRQRTAWDRLTGLLELIDACRHALGKE